MSVLWILLIVLLALALFGGIGYRGGWRRGDTVDGGGGGGFGVSSSVVGLVVFVVLVVLLISLLT